MEIIVMRIVRPVIGCFLRRCKSWSNTMESAWVGDPSSNCWKNVLRHFTDYCKLSQLRTHGVISSSGCIHLIRMPQNYNYVAVYSVQRPVILDFYKFQITCTVDAYLCIQSLFDVPNAKFKECGDVCGQKGLVFVNLCQFIFSKVRIQYWLKLGLLRKGVRKMSMIRSSWPNKGFFLTLPLLCMSVTTFRISRLYNPEME